MAEKINGFDDGVRIVPMYEAAPDLFESFGYTKLVDVPAFLAILVSKEKNADVKAGYYGEAMCLDMTERGIKTCWVSGSIKKQNVKKYIGIETSERFLTSIAFGYGEDKTPEAVAARRNRKTLDKLFEGELNDKAIESVMTCVQNAPSAINRQPWRYGVQSGALYPGGPFPEGLDIGISMLHASVAASALGTKGAWQTDKTVLGRFVHQ